MLDGEKSVLVEFFGDSPTMRVIDFFICYDCFEYTLTEIAENACVGWTTLHSILPKLEEFEIIKLTRTVGRAKLYKLNTENAMIKSLMRFDMKLCKYYAEKEIESQMMKVKA